MRKVLIIVENLPVPFDRRVWQEARTLHQAGYQVSIICPIDKGYTARYEVIDGIHIYRHPLPLEANGALGYLLEYSAALFWEFLLSIKVLWTRGFDVIHACNPPDTIFSIGLFYKLFGKKYLFDHHDITPELFFVKFSRKNLLYRLVSVLETLSFKVADVSIATNESYRRIAIERGGMSPDKVFVVRSGPRLEEIKANPPNESLKNGRKYLAGYVGIMGNQDGLDSLLRIVHKIVNDHGRSDIQFLLIGGGPEYENLQRYAKELEITDFVTFTGFLTGNDLLSAIGSIDVGVAPDIANDYNDKCTMNKVMEYMALGKPIVQYDLTEGRFSARGASLYAEVGCETDFADKLLTLLDDPGLRTEMGEYGRKRLANELAWKYEEPKLLEAYDAIFEARVRSV
jgi:glycosyltransferase involved in cell wall biosynthesis